MQWYNQSTSDEDGENEVDIKTMLSNILMEIKYLKKQNEDFKNETKQVISDLTEEIKALDKRTEAKYCSLETRINNIDNSTNKKIINLETKVKWLQEAEERRLRKEKRNNVIVKSKDFGTGNVQELHEKVKEILRKTESNPDFMRATYIGKNKMDMGLARVEFKSLDEQITVMKNKNKLKGENYYINDDMTK